VCVHTMLSQGGRCILIPRFTAKSYAKQIVKYKCNFIAGVPTLYEALLRLPSMDGANLSSLKGVFSGGDSLSIELKKKFDKFLYDHKASIQVREGYGTTETVTACCLTPPHMFKEGSIGLPFPDTYIKIVKPDTDEEVPYGEEGEILLAGPTVMKEYMNNPEETARTLRKHADGLTWVYTGDLGTMDDQGFIYFKGRAKRMIISSGYNVYPGQLENILDAAGENIPYVLSMMGAAELHEEEFSEGMQGQDANAHEHSDHDHGHGENGGGDDAEDEETEYDEHIWTSPVTAMALCRAIGETLCQADPDHADSYRQRLADYLAELESLDQSFRDAVADGSRKLLVFGDRFPFLYFCREYGLDYRAAFHGCAGDTEPSLATLKYLIDLVNEEHIPVVYTIELSSRKVAEAIAETTGAAVRTFQSCQTVSRADFDNGVTYLQLMEANVDALREGLA
jgi:ABC-type Zn uptake system ZnuABC Zn-binding protein ZnuA